MGRSVEEKLHLPVATLYTRCTEVFLDVACARDTSKDDYRLMAELSSLLLYAWAFYHYGKRQRGDGLRRWPGAIPLDHAIDAYAVVCRGYTGQLRTRPDLMLYGPYWGFINEMRRTALAIAFQERPRCSVDDLARMAKWCRNIGDHERSKARRPSCWG